jgi:hypothetical protein
MSTPSDGLGRREIACQIGSAQHRLGDGCGIDDIVRASDARLDAVHVHDSQVRGLL